MRRNIRRHTHSYSDTAIQEEVWDLARENCWLLAAAVVAGTKKHRVLFNVLKTFIGNPRHLHLGVPHRGSIIAIDRSEVSLSMHQRIAHREILGHADKGFVHRRVTMRVVFSEHISDHGCGFLIFCGTAQPHLVHGKKDAAMHGLESVSRIWKGTCNNDRHRIVEIALLHFGNDWSRGNAPDGAECLAKRLLDGLLLCGSSFGFGSPLR